MREDDKRIAEWFYQQDGEYWIMPNGGRCHNSRLSDFAEAYTTSDADAISLLSVLVERGYATDLSYVPLWGWWCGIMDSEVNWVIMPLNHQSTIAAAITTAVLQLIDMEKLKC